MAITVYVGTTWRVTAADLLHLDTGPVTTGATVTISLYDSDGVLATSGTATADDDDWYVDLSMPSEPGQYDLKIVAEHDSATAKHKDKVTVKSF